MQLLHYSICKRRSKKPFSQADSISSQQIGKYGFGEFILTGTNVGSYGKDIDLNLAKLLKKLSQIRGVRRIRIGSLEPIQIDDEFMELLDESWMAKHLHIALQHCSDKMLKIMNRRNSFVEDLELFNKLAQRGYALGTDFIVGHPGEGDVEWKEAMERIDMLPLTHIHAFTYSPREGTASADMGAGVRGDIAKARHKELTAKIKEKNYEFRKAHPKALEVLLERGKNGIYHGYDQYYNKVTVKSDNDLESSWVYLDDVDIQKDGNYATFY